MSLTEQNRPPEQPKNIDYEVWKREQRKQFEAGFVEAGFKGSELERILKGFDVGAEAHKDQRRETGEPFFAHPIESALILLSLSKKKGEGLRDPNTYIAELLHDTVEDTSYWGALEEGMLYKDFVEETYWAIRKEFGPEVALMILTLSKPKIDGVEIKTASQVENIFALQLRRGRPYKLALSRFEKIRWADSLRSRILLAKLAERLHNLKTIYGQDRERIFRKIKETHEILIPICDKFKSEHPKAGYQKETEYLIGSVYQEMSEIIEKWKPE